MVRRKRKKDEVNLVALFLVALGVLFLIQQGDTFMGAFITTENNTEPLTMDDWTNESVALNGTLTLTDPIQFGTNTSLVDLETYNLTGTVLGDFKISDVDGAGYSCTAALDYINEEIPTSSYSVIEFRNVLIVPGGFKWCNYNDGIMLSAPIISSISEYQNLYVDRVEVDIGLTGSECVEAGYDWNGLNCLCDDGETLVTSANFTCPEINETETTPAPAPAATTSTPAASTTTTSAQATPEEPQSYLDAGIAWAQENQTYVILIVVLLFIVLYYAFYEKGPGGLFKNF